MRGLPDDIFKLHIFFLQLLPFANLPIENLLSRYLKNYHGYETQIWPADTGWLDHPYRQANGWGHSVS